MSDQAHQLRKLVRATVQVDASLAPGGPVIAISGGQPGVGVTTIACGLARELARLGKQVILIDANLERPGAHKTFNSEPATIGNLHNVLAGTRRVVEILVPTPEEGVRLLAGCPPHATPPLDREAVDRFAAEVAALSRQVDFVLLDAGSGMNAWIDRLWQLARQVLLVGAPDAQCLLDSYAAVKLSQHHRLDGKLRLLLNRVHDESEGPPLAQRFAETCQRFLFITPKPAASLPAIARRHPAARNDATAADDESFRRAVRLLAADLAADFRVSALRLVQPKNRATQNVKASSSVADLTQSRRDAEGAQTF